MSLTSAGSQRDKFGYLFQLAQEQIKALEADDMYAFDRILAARGTIIDSFVDAHAQVAADPALQTLATQIQECDRSAQRLLYRKVGRIMRSMSEIQQAKLARRAYFQDGRPPSPRAFEFQPEPHASWISSPDGPHRIFFGPPASNKPNGRAV